MLPEVPLLNLKAGNEEIKKETRETGLFLPIHLDESCLVFPKQPAPKKLFLITKAMDRKKQSVTAYSDTKKEDQSAQAQSPRESIGESSDKSQKAEPASPEKRRLMIQRYLAKKDKRRWRKIVSYDSRKKVAERRVRLNGRFVSKKEGEIKEELIEMEEGKKPQKQKRQKLKRLQLSLLSECENLSNKATFNPVFQIARNSPIICNDSASVNNI
jgi:hypothetical protein